MDFEKKAVSLCQDLRHRSMQMDNSHEKPCHKCKRIADQLRTAYVEGIEDMRKAIANICLQPPILKNFNCFHGVVVAKVIKDISVEEIQSEIKSLDRGTQSW